MKKMFFYAAVAAVAFASCSKDNGVEVPNNIVEDETLEAIVFKMGNSIEVTTRGTGSVGDMVDSLNVWAGEKLNVYMFNKGTMEIAVNPTDEKAYFDNAEIVAPLDTAAGVADYGTVKYYASNKTYDFFAYHADDAINTVPVVDADSTVYTVPFTINGTQDLMTAKAKMNAAEIQEFATKNYDAKRAYSAYSARRGVQPRFSFQHELSRFVFNVIGASSDSTALGLSIDSVKVVDAQTTGVMTVAALVEDSLGVKFDETKKATLTLMDRANAGQATQALNSVAIDTLGAKIRLGESMLLAPGVSEYVVKVYYSQVKDGKTLKDVYEAPVALKNNQKFAKGSQYDVNITVYGFQMIELICELTAWADGEDVELDSEQ